MEDCGKVTGRESAFASLSIIDKEYAWNGDTDESKDFPHYVCNATRTATSIHDAALLSHVL